MAYRRMLRDFCDAYESLDVSEREGIDYVAQIERTGLPDGRYDAVFCTQVLHHLPEPQRALDEIARLLRPGGRAVISVPHLSWLHNEPHDYYRFTIHGLRHMFGRAGLEEIEIQPVGGLVCFLAYAPSTFGLALLRPMGPLFHLGLFLNRLFIRCALLADGLVGLASLYPTNYVAVVEKPLSSD